MYIVIYRSEIKLQCMTSPLKVKLNFNSIFDMFLYLVLFQVIPPPFFFLNPACYSFVLGLKKKIFIE